MPDHPVHKAVLSLIQDDFNVLQLTFGSRKVKVGEKIPKGEARAVPTLTWTSAPPGQQFMVICLDIDVPFPSFPPLGPALHWLQTGYTLEAATSNLTSLEPAIASYHGPGPPLISSPHRYIFSLHKQPEDFDAKMFTKANGYGIKDRMRYDFAKLEKDAKLGPAVAGAYFLSN